MRTRVFVCSLLVAFISAGTALAGASVSAGKAYVSNANSDDVTVVDLATMTTITTIAVGDEPRGPAISPDGTRVYVPNRFDDSLTVINTATDAVVTTVPLSGSEPYNCAVTPDGLFVYVVEKGSSTVSVFSTVSNTEVDTILLTSKSSSPEGIAITPDGAKVYVVNRGDDTVDVISTLTNTVVAGPIAVVNSPRDAYVTADGSKVLVVGEGAPVAIVVATDTANAAIGGSKGNQRDVDISGNTAYVTNMIGFLDVYDMTTETYVTSIAMSVSTPYGVDILSDGSFGWVTGADSDTLQGVNLPGLVESGTSAATGSGARGVVILEESAGGGGITTFLPTSVKVKIVGAGRDKLAVKGTFDDSGLVADYTDVSFQIGDFVQAFSPVPKGSGTFVAKASGVRLKIVPDLKSSSHAKFALKVSKTTLGGLVDPNAPVEMHLLIDGLPDMEATVDLENGRYKLGRNPGDLVDAEFFPSRAVAKLSGEGRDRLTLRGGFASDGETPDELDPVTVEFGPDYSVTIPGTSFVKSGDRFKHKAKVGSTTTTVILDFSRNTVHVKAKNIELGPLDEPTTDISLDAGTGDGLITVPVELGVRGNKRLY
jgi:YVTN family beta-propeller protein